MKPISRVPPKSILLSYFGLLCLSLGLGGGLRAEDSIEGVSVEREAETVVSVGVVEEAAQSREEEPSFLWNEMSGNWRVTGVKCGGEAFRERVKQGKEESVHLSWKTWNLRFEKGKPGFSHLVLGFPCGSQAMSSGLAAEHCVWGERLSQALLEEKKEEGQAWRLRYRLSGEGFTAMSRGSLPASVSFDFSSLKIPKDSQEMDSLSVSLPHWLFFWNQLLGIGTAQSNVLVHGLFSKGEKSLDHFLLSSERNLPCTELATALDSEPLSISEGLLELQLNR